MESFLKLPRNVYLLAISQIFGMSATSLIFLIGGLIGVDIAPSPKLATLPVTLMIVGLALMTIPAVMLMKKIGRKKGFILSTLLAALASLVAAYAMSISNFYLFCLATFLIGTNGAFMQQYRFAALESVPSQLASKAVSLVLFAGVISGFLGPEIAKITQNLFSSQGYIAAFITLSLIFIASSLLLSLTKNSTIHDEKTTDKERPLQHIVTQPTFLLSALSACVGFGVMLFIMTATPLYMHKMSHFGLNETVMVIQSHIIAMFLPSLFTGLLIARFGIFRIITAGLICFLTTVTLAVNGHGLLPYWVALILLGIGWNFLFISSTLLLSRSYTHTERFKAQGTNDFVIVLTQMLVSLSAGSLLFSVGWVNLNLLTLPLIIVTFAVFLLYRKRLALATEKV
jgi:MFS family permease